MSYNMESMFMIAKLYYKDNLKQDSIARKLNISKYKVNRVLKRAVAEGVVQINIVKLDTSIIKKGIAQYNILLWCTLIIVGS